MKTLTKEQQEKLTPKEAFDLLKKGHERFLENTKMHRDLYEAIEHTKEAQHPFAIILSCIDSRVPIEIVFDQAFGDVFVARIAGNVINDDILGSIEYAVKVVGVKLVFVLGHTNCGAVAGAVSDIEMGHITGLVSKIKPAIFEAKQHGEDLPYTKFEDKVSHVNVEMVKKQLFQRSKIVNEFLESGKIALKGGVYDVNSGKVNFLD
ncbi:MAG TPA: carbonic anhydrase [Flavobacteriales bacterium]|nr:carbonic anhydrase [Flavobacteriales bacterium]|tara:strand:- start:45888 stop:46505 length:618 start_codon:yes stop_codon:yes gene_type:complete